MRNLTLFSVLLAVVAQASAQAAPATPDPKVAQAALEKKQQADHMRRATEHEFRLTERDGVEVRIKDIGHFRGIRSNQLTGFGLVIGLQGTGDSKKTPMTVTMLANLFKSTGISFDPLQLDAKNVALVSVTAQLTAFAKPGTAMDVLVSSMGDAKSLQGGTLLQTPLYAAVDKEVAYVVAEGPVSIGGFQAGSAGNSVQKNHLTVGRVPGGGIVEASVPTKLVFGSNMMYLDLDTEDLTTAQRVANRLMELFPSYLPSAIDGSTISLTLPEHVSPIKAMSNVETVNVFADVPAVVVINERTGTIIIGGNVRLGPAAIAHGSLNIRIDQTLIISQPASLSNGTTVVANQTNVQADQVDAKVAIVPPSATVQDLARILQALELKPADIIAILQGLRQQGALKARIEIQ